MVRPISRISSATSFDHASPALDEALAETPPAPDAPVEDEATELAAVVEAATPAKRSWRERLSGSSFARGLSSLFIRHPKLDDDLLDELETTLITADVGVEASTALVEDLRKRMHRREFADAGALLAALRQSLIAMLRPVEKPLDVGGLKPYVILTVGINGVGHDDFADRMIAASERPDIPVIEANENVPLLAGAAVRSGALAAVSSWLWPLTVMLVALIGMATSKVYV